MRRITIYMGLLMLLSVVPGYPALHSLAPGTRTTGTPDEDEPPAPRLWPPSQAAVQAALEDAKGLNQQDRYYVRYLWCPDAQFKLTNLALNVISRGNTIVRALPLKDGKLLRVDARHYARFFVDSHGENQDIKEWVQTWEELRYDPNFNLLITQDNVRFSALKPKKFKTRRVTRIIEEKVKVAPYRAVDDGQIYDYKYVDREVTIEIPEEQKDDDKAHVVLRLNPDYLPQLAELQKLLYSEAPVVLDRYFLSRALQAVKKDPAVKDDNAYTTIWGGLYYEFRGIKRSREKGVTDEDLFYKQFGIDNIQSFFDALQSDQRAALFRSGVTGRQRRIDFFNTPAGHAWDVMGIGSTTHDVRAEDIDVAAHPLMNLLLLKDNARESIFVGANGMHVYAIFNGQGQLLDETAINVVSDRTVPDPHPPRLQPAISCMACHEAEGSDGWRDAANDVKKLLSSRTDPLTGRRLLDLDLIADINFKDQIGVLNRIAGLYEGDFRKGMMRSRDDYAEAVLKAVGPMGEDQTAIVKTAVSEAVSLTRKWIYDPIDARQALLELGQEAGKNPVQTLRDLLPPEPAAIGFHPEDPRIAALKKGLSIPRTDFAFVYSYMASRMNRKKGE